MRYRRERLPELACSWPEPPDEEPDAESRGGRWLLDEPPDEEPDDVSRGGRSEVAELPCELEPCEP